jgi:type III secretion system FlhB-like substrate exporter
MPRAIVEEATLPAPTGRMPDEGPAIDPLDEEATTPEEQQFYDTFMNKAIEFIHGPKSSRDVLKHLNQKDMSVPEAVGRTTAMIAKNIVQSAKLAEVKVSPDAIFGAGQEIVEELLELGSRAGIFPIDWPEDDKAELSPEQEKMAQDAFATAAQFYGQDLLKSPEGEALSREAQSEVLRQVQSEVKSGRASPDFMVTNGDSVEGGVKRALIASNGGRMPNGQP